MSCLELGSLGTCQRVERWLELGSLVMPKMIELDRALKQPGLIGRDQQPSPGGDEVFRSPPAILAAGHVVAGLDRAALIGHQVADRDHVLNTSIVDMREGMHGAQGAHSDVGTDLLV